MKKKIGIVLLLTFLISLLAVGCGEKSVATVNGEKITQSSFDKIVNLYVANFKQSYNTDPSKDAAQMKQIKEMALDDMIDQLVLYQEATKQKYKASSSEIATSLKTFKEQTGGETGYKSFLKLASMTDAEFKEEIGKQIVIGKLADKVTKNVTASEAEAKAYYDTHLSEFGTPREVKVSHILVKTEKEAYDVLEKLEAGADFGDLAQKVSIEPAAKQSKGDLGWVNADTGFVAEFKEAALKLKKGEMTMTPVKTQFGYHIIKAFDEKQAKIEKFESVKDEAKVKAKAEKQKTTWSNYVETLKKKAIIKKTLES